MKLFFISLIFCLFIASCVYHKAEDIEIIQPKAPNTNQKYIVTASGMVFTLASLTINQGDTVEWQNISGFHNVNGSQATYPANPENFGNAVAGSPWTFTFVFNTIGNYDYQCDVHVGNGMVGVITVQ